MGKIVSASEIDRIFKMPKNSTRRDIWRNKLKAEKIGRDWLVSMDEAHRLYGYRLEGLQNEGQVKSDE